MVSTINFSSEKPTLFPKPQAFSLYLEKIIPVHWHQPPFTKSSVWEMSCLLLKYMTWVCILRPRGANLAVNSGPALHFHSTLRPQESFWCNCLNPKDHDLFHGSFLWPLYLPSIPSLKPNHGLTLRDHRSFLKPKDITPQALFSSLLYPSPSSPNVLGRWKLQEKKSKKSPSSHKPLLLICPLGYNGAQNLLWAEMGAGKVEKRKLWRE